MTVPDLKSDWHVEIPTQSIKDSAQVHQTPRVGSGDKTSYLPTQPSLGPMTFGGPTPYADINGAAYKMHSSGVDAE